MALAIDDAWELRTRGVEALQVLDTPQEERFDRHTRLARLALDAPISTVTLIDRDRAFFKSCIGIDDLHEMPANQTFCDVGVRRGGPMFIEDALIDPDLRFLPAVVGEPHIRSYAGYPLHDAYGSIIGMFCVYDTRPRSFTEREKAVLAELTSSVEQDLLTAHESDRATSVQQALLPSTPPVVPGYTAAAVCLPTHVVAGDFFDHQQHGDDHLFAVADVMGKGTAAAILTATTRAVLRSQARALALGQLGDDADLGTMVTAVNDVLLDDLAASDSFVTGFVGWAEPTSGLIRYVDAGHGLSVVVREDGRTERLATHDLPLGVTPDARWNEQHLVLAHGDALVIFSDGLLDLFGGSLDGVDHVARLVSEHPEPRDLVRQVTRLAHRVPVRDDVTVMAVRRDAGGLRLA